MSSNFQPPLIQSVGNSIPILFFPFGDIGEECSDVLNRFCNEITEIESKEVPSLIESCSKFKINPPSVLRVGPIFCPNITHLIKIVQTIQEHVYSFSLAYFVCVGVVDNSLMTNIPSDPLSLVDKIPEIKALSLPSPIRILIFNATPSMADMHSENIGLIFNTQKGDVAISVLSDFLSPQTATSAAQILSTIPSNISVTGVSEIESESNPKKTLNKNIYSVLSVKGNPILIARKALSDFAFISKNYQESIRQISIAVQNSQITYLFSAAFYELLFSIETILNLNSSKFKNLIPSDIPKFSMISDDTVFSTACAFYFAAHLYGCAADIALYATLTKKYPYAFSLSFRIQNNFFKERGMYNRAIDLILILKKLNMTKREAYVLFKFSNLYSIPELSFRAIELMVDNANPSSTYQITQLCVPFFHSIKSTFGNASLSQISIKMLSNIGYKLSTSLQTHLFESALSSPTGTFSPFGLLMPDSNNDAFTLQLPLQIKSMEFIPFNFSLKKISPDTKGKVFLYSYISKDSNEIIIPANSTAGIQVSLFNPFSISLWIFASLIITNKDGDCSKTTVKTTVESNTEMNGTIQTNLIQNELREINLMPNTVNNFSLHFSSPPGNIVIHGISFTAVSPSNIGATPYLSKQELIIEKPIELDVIDNAPMIQVRTDLSLTPMTKYHGEEFDFTVWVVNFGHCSLSDLSISFGSNAHTVALNNPKRPLRPNQEFEFKCHMIADKYDPPLEIIVSSKGNNCVATTKLVQVINVIPSLIVSRIFMLNHPLEVTIRKQPFHLSSLFQNLAPPSVKNQVKFLKALSQINTEKMFKVDQINKILEEDKPISKICIGYEIVNVSDCSIIYYSLVNKSTREGFIGKGESILLIAEYNINEIFSDGTNASKDRVHKIILQQEEKLKRSLSLSERKDIARAVGGIMKLEETWKFQWAVSNQEKGILNLEDVSLDNDLYQKIMNPPPEFSIVISNENGKISNQNPAKKGDAIQIIVDYSFHESIQGKTKCELFLPKQCLKSGDIMWEGDLIQYSDETHGKATFILFLGNLSNIELKFSISCDKFEEIIEKDLFIE